MSMPLAVSAFTAGVQQAVSEQLALAAGLTKADAGKVFLADIAATEQRAASSQGVSFVAELSLATDAAAAAAVAGLSAGNINTFLAAAGLPAARITAPPAVRAPPAPAAVAVEATPAPTITVGGMPLTTIIAIASSVGGAVGLMALACCLQRLHKCGFLPRPVQRCLPTQWYDPERTRAEDERRLAAGTAREVLQMLKPPPTAPELTPGHGAATAPEVMAHVEAEGLPSSVGGRPPPYVPAHEGPARDRSTGSGPDYLVSEFVHAPPGRSGGLSGAC